MSTSVIAQLYAFAEAPEMPPCDFEPASTVEHEDLATPPTDPIPISLGEFGPALVDPPAEEIPAPLEDVPPPGDPDLWLYRKRTVGLLRKYMRLSIEVGRLPSLLGREFFRAKVTSYTVVTFEDRVIFVHDMETCLNKLDEFSRQIIARHILQEHDQAATARLLQCAERTVRNYVPIALDVLSEILLDVGLLERIVPIREKSCQGGETGEMFVSGCEESKNKF